MSGHMLRGVRVVVSPMNQGGPDKLIFEQIQIPDPVQSQVVVRIRAAGINFVDTYHRAGRPGYQGVTQLGLEGAGVVIATGEDVHEYEIGDRVLWWGVPGSYSTHVTTTSDKLVKIPSEIVHMVDSDSDLFELCASIPVQALTAHYLVTSCITNPPLQPDDFVLIHAGAGGTGGLAIQMAKILGAKVITTVSTAEKEEIARENGADYVIRYTQEDFHERVMEITGNAGVRAVLDGVGGATCEKSLACVRRRGTLVLFGNASENPPRIDPLKLTKQGSVMLMRPTLRHFVADPTEKQKRLDEIFGWVSSRKLRVRIGLVEPLGRIRHAHEALEGRQTIGKVVVIPPHTT